MKFYLTLLILLVNTPIFAADLYISPSGSGTACTIGVPCSQATGLSQAVAGDEVVAVDGTYQSVFNITSNSNSGTSSSPIVLRAQNRHQAILKGNNSTSDSNRNISINRSWWIIDGFMMTESCDSIRISASGGNNEIRNNIIHDFLCNGVAVNNSKDNYIHDNAIAFSPIEAQNAEAGIQVIFDSDRTIVENNIVYSMTQDGHQSGSKEGYSILLADEIDNSIVRGNLVMDGAKGSIRIFSETGRAPLVNNIIEDNIVAFVGDGINLLHGGTNSTTVRNNIIYGARHTSFNAKGNSPGNNILTHNTIVLTDLARHGVLLNTENGIASENTVIKDNLFYSTYSSSSSKNKFLFVGTGFSTSVSEMDFNLFWRPGSVNDWSTTNVVYGSNDIHNSGSQPAFVSEVNGDFTLSNGSVGKNAASDGTDMGITFNNYLKKQWMQNILLLPTENKDTNGSTSIAFSASSNHQYQVYGYVPESSPFSGNQTFVIEGKNITRDLQEIINNQFVGSAPQRWFYLGTHPNDGTINITWTNSNASSAFYVRQLPTPTEAFAWLSQTPPPFSGPGKYVSPSGSGSACTTETPCSQATGLGQVVGGERIIFKNGTYTWFDTTQVDVTLIAENKHLAIIASEDAHTGGVYAIGVKHSGTVIDGLRITGQADGDDDLGGGSGHGLVRVFQVNSLKIQNAIIENSAGELLNFCGTHDNDCSNLIVQDSTFLNAGQQTDEGGQFGESIYICQFQGNNTCKNITIRRNIITNFLDQAIDVKPGGINVEIYYNIIQGQSTQPQQHASAVVDGVLVDQSGKVVFHHNIIRNNDATFTSGSSTLRMPILGNKVYDNVIYSNLYAGSYLIRERAGGGGAATEIFNNVICSNSGTAVESTFTNVHDNTFGTGTPSPDCSAKETEILALMTPDCT